MQRGFLAGRDREEKTLGAADEGIAAFVEAKELIGGTRDTDSNGLADGIDGEICFSEPQRARGAEVQTVVAAVDLKSCSEASGAASEIEKPSGLAVALHELNTFQWLDRADENRRGDSCKLAHDVEHEVRAVVEKNVGVAAVEIHRANARSRASEMMSCGIAGRIGFRFHDAAAEPARGEIVDDNFADKEASELDGVRWKFGAAKAANKELRR